MTTAALTRRMFLTAGIAIPAVASAMPAQATEAEASAIVTPEMFGDTSADATDAMVAAFADPRPLVLTPGRSYYVRPDALVIRTPGKRVYSPTHAAVSGNAKIWTDRPGGTLVRVAAHSAVLQGIEITGPGRASGLGCAVRAMKDPYGWGDLDLTVAGCTITGANVGLSVIGRGLFCRETMFNDTRYHVALDMAAPTAPAVEHWQTMEGGARKYVIDSCYFHSASTASVAVLGRGARFIHGVHITDAHHDAPQPLFVGVLSGGVISGCSVYRLAKDGIVLRGRSRGSLINGNLFAGARGEAPMRHAVYAATGARVSDLIFAANQTPRGGVAVKAARGASIKWRMA